MKLITVQVHVRTTTTTRARRFQVGNSSVQTKRLGLQRMAAMAAERAGGVEEVPGVAGSGNSVNGALPQLWCGVLRAACPRTKCRRLRLPSSAVAATMESSALRFLMTAALQDMKREYEEEEEEVVKLAWARQLRSPVFDALMDKLTSRHLSADALAWLSELKGGSGAGPSSSSSGVRRKEKKRKKNKNTKRRRKTRRTITRRWTCSGSPFTCSSWCFLRFFPPSSPCSVV